MKLAFVLFKYFPFGGLQRDFLKIALECCRRGHQVKVYTQSWEGEIPTDRNFSLQLLAKQGWQNHRRNFNFSQQVQQQLLHVPADLTIGFNKMPGLDVYYAADTCYEAKAQLQHSFWYRLTARYRQLVRLERAVFTPDAKTTILTLAKNAAAEYQHYYATQTSRFHLLPPGISRDRVGAQDKNTQREAISADLKITLPQYILLFIGSGFKTKGLDRVLTGMANLPPALKAQIQLFVVGQDNPTYFQKLAAKLFISEQIMFLGGRSDIPIFLAASDVLVHPAYNENTGSVLLEALVSGLPVLTTDVCGYADYIRKAHAGIVLTSPFLQDNFNQALANMLLSPQREQWRQNGLAYAETADIYELPARAVDIIESLCSYT
jgi:UDP-glucose:(heptosyl)LPS alpha-1,3-glucosyltransferase